MADSPVALTQQAARNTAKAARQVLQTLPPLGDMGRRVPPTSKPRLFLVVESPWYTAEQMGLTPPHYGTVVAAVRLPLLDELGAAVDIPTGLLAVDAADVSCYVTERDSTGTPPGFPTKAMTAGGEKPVTKLYCGPTLCGRPFRTQIVWALPSDGKWWLAGTLNPTMFATYIDATTVRIGLPNGGGGTVDPIMDTAAAEYDENSQMPATKFDFSLDMGFAADDVVIVSWIGNAYFMLPVQCSELVA